MGQNMKAYNIRIRNNEFFPRSNIYTDSPQKKKKNRATFFKQTGGSTFITRGVIYGLAHRFELYEIARDFCKRVTKKKQKKIKK